MRKYEIIESSDPRFENELDQVIEEYEGKRKKNAEKTRARYPRAVIRSAEERI